MFSAKKLSVVCAIFGSTLLLSACGGGSSGNVGTTSSTSTGVASTSTVAGTAAASVPTASSSTSATPTVAATSASTVAVSWTPPTQNTDGSSLTNLAGYKVYYGTSPDNLSDSIRVDANVTSYMMTGLISGTTYYFAVTSMNDVGVESDRSNVASKTV